MRKQKPEPDGLLLCLEKLTGLASGHVFYIGDHETDVQCAAKANNLLRKKGVNLWVLTIAAFYGSDHDDSGWKTKPDYKANQTQDIVEIIQPYTGTAILK